MRTRTFLIVILVLLVSSIVGANAGEVTTQKWYDPGSVSMSWLNGHDYQAYSRTHKGGVQVDIVRKGTTYDKLVEPKGVKRVKTCKNPIYRFLVTEVVPVPEAKPVPGPKGEKGDKGDMVVGPPGPPGPPGSPGEVKVVYPEKGVAFRSPKGERMPYYEQGWFGAGVSWVLGPRSKITNNVSATGGNGFGAAAAAASSSSTSSSTSTTPTSGAAAHEGSSGASSSGADGSGCN